MSPYVPVIVWVLGSGCSYLIMQKRGVRLTVLKNILVGFLGPLSIPFALAFSKDKQTSVA